jgi:hypothetical protein
MPSLQTHDEFILRYVIRSPIAPLPFKPTLLQVSEVRGYGAVFADGGAKARGGLVSLTGYEGVSPGG